MNLRTRLALRWSPDLSTVLRHVDTALTDLGEPAPDTPAHVAAAVTELQAARALLRGEAP